MLQRKRFTEFCERKQIKRQGNRREGRVKTPWKLLLSFLLPYFGFWALIFGDPTGLSFGLEGYSLRSTC